MSSAFEKLAEQKIEEAIKNGVFDKLSNKGEKLDLDAYFATPAHLRMGFSVLKSGGFVPPEVEMMQEIDALEKKLISEPCDKACKKLEIQVAHKKAELAMAMERIKAQSKNNLGNQAW